MIYQVQVQADPPWQAYTERLIHAANQTLEQQSAEAGTLTIVLTDSNRIRDLNITFTGEDHATDVLSFADGSVDPDSGRPYFGDVIVAVDIAELQAQRTGHPLIAELSLLTIHGILHLLGHDHANETDKKKMWSAQEEILESLNIKLGPWLSEND